MPSTSTNATEFCRFINALPDSLYFDDCSDELWKLLWEYDNTKKEWKVRAGKADYEFVIENDFGGYIAWQGEGTDPHDGARNCEIVFNEWRKAQTTKTIVVVVPNEKVEAVVAALKELEVEPVL
jgi:hypothetical protein